MADPIRLHPLPQPAGAPAPAPLSGPDAAGDTLVSELFAMLIPPDFFARGAARPAAGAASMTVMDRAAAAPSPRRLAEPPRQLHDRPQHGPATLRAAARPR